MTTLIVSHVKLVICLLLRIAICLRSFGSWLAELRHLFKVLLYLGVAWITRGFRGKQLGIILIIGFVHNTTHNLHNSLGLVKRPSKGFPLSNLRPSVNEFFGQQKCLSAFAKKTEISISHMYTMWLSDGVSPAVSSNKQRRPINPCSTSLKYT